MSRSAFKPMGVMRVGRAIALLVVLVSGAPISTASGAATGSRNQTESFVRAAPDWMSGALAGQLALSFDVLVPSSVPAPFDGEPSVTAYDGYYSLYWMVPGTPPTFLQIAGEVGGAIPDYSKYDRNNPLEQNSEVDGVPAYHDLTPIYDLVYWEVGGIVYSVESHNLTEDDSLTLANALVALTAPGENTNEPAGDASLSMPDRVNAGETTSIQIEGVDGATLSADDGVFTDTGDSVYDGISAGSVNWQAPSPGEDTWVSFTVADADSGQALASGSILVLAVQDAPASLSLDCPAAVSSGERLEFTLTGNGEAIVDAGEGSLPAESPNTDFAPDGGDGRTMVGTVPDGGAATLVWIAPEISEPATYYLFATNMQGETTGECAIDVVPLFATESDGSSGDAEIGDGEVAAAGSEPEGGEEDTERQQDSNDGDEEERNDENPAPTEVINEVRGIPTAAPSGEEDGETDTPASPSPTPNLTPTARPTATIAPTLSEDGMAATIVGPEGGSLSSSRGATVVIPAGTLSEPATLSILPVAGTKLPVQDGVELIPDSGFDVSIAGPNGLALDQELVPPAELRIDLGEDGMREGARIYRVQGSTLVPLANTRIEGNTLVITVDRFSRFVAGVPTTVQGTRNRSLLPFILAAVVVVLVMIGMIVLGGMFRPRRQRIVVSRRPQRQRSRYR